VRQNLTSIRLSQALVNLLRLPVLDFKVSSYGLVEEVSAVAIHSFGEAVEGVDFSGIKAETDSAFVHKTQYYTAYK
jgi:hypothetical protein